MTRPRLSLGAAVLAAALCAGCDAFLDAATAIAYDIEAGVGRLERSRDSVTTIVHVPSASRGG
jgi:outer membrane murein-binding lipoprotein Lpp